MECYDCKIEMLSTENVDKTIFKCPKCGNIEASLKFKSKK